jgi:hypothetical protein
MIHSAPSANAMNSAANVAKLRLALQVLPRHSVDFGRGGVDLPFGVDPEMHRAAGRAAVGHLESRELDDPVPLLRIEPRRFRVDDDLAHARR